MKKLYTTLTLFAFISVTANAQSSACSNKDFGLQNFNNWVGQTGSNNGQSNLGWTGGFISNGNDAPVNDMNGRQTIITLNALDSFCIDPLTNAQDVYMTTLAPNGGTASVRLGNSINGMGAEGIKYTVTVNPPYNQYFTYQYSCIFEDPGHALLDQPGFAVNLYDQNNIIIPALCDTIYSGDPQYAFINSNFTPNGVKYKRWSSVTIDLTAYAGQNVTIEFNNFDCAYGGHFGYTYLDVTCFGSPIANVWPGDCDYDLEANYVDLLSLGISFGATGATRPGASNTWTAQPMTDWSQSFQLGANYKHSDCNGDGVVDIQDTVAISQNYSNTHPFRLQAPPQVNVLYPPIILFADDDTAGTNQVVNFDIYVGGPFQPIDSLYGITFKLNYPIADVQANLVNCTYNTSWLGTLGTDMIQMQRNFPTQGYIDVALVRNEQSNIDGGWGPIGTLKVKMPPSGTNIVTVPVTISNVYAITVGKRVVTLDLQPGSVVFNPNLTGVNTPAFDDFFGLYPNPSSGIFTLKANDNVSSIEIMNALGQVVMTVTATGNQTLIDATSLAAGIYTVRVTNNQGTFHTKLQLTN